MLSNVRKEILLNYYHFLITVVMFIFGPAPYA